MKVTGAEHKEWKISESFGPPDLTGMWTPKNEQCKKCAGKSYYGKGEPCPWCDLRQDDKNL